MNLKKENNLQNALNNPLWLTHSKDDVYTMDNKVDKWKIIYYPIFENGKTNKVYDEPRALVQNIDKPGFWSKEVPLRYLKKT